MHLKNVFDVKQTLSAKRSRGVKRLRIFLEVLLFYKRLLIPYNFQALVNLSSHGFNQ